MKFQVIVSQMERDEQVRSLFDDLNDLLETLGQQREERLRDCFKDEIQAGILERIFYQIKECLIFIRDYAENISFCKPWAKADIRLIC